MTKEELIEEVLYLRGKKIEDSTRITLPPPEKISTLPPPAYDAKDNAVHRLQELFRQRQVTCLTATIGRKDGNAIWIVSVDGPRGLVSMAVMLGQKEFYAESTLKEVVTRVIAHVFRDDATS